MNPKVYTPAGVQDILFEQCEQKRAIEQKIREHLKSNGYREIETPSIEYFDTFSTGVGRIAQEKMVKFSDSDGKMLVLRPDLTIPAVRMYATKLKQDSETVKLFYIGNTFNSTDGGGRLKEYTQAGAEIIGGQGVYVDAEIITRAVMLAKGMGLQDFLVDICQVEFFKGLMEEAGFDAEEAEEIREMVDGKQIGNLESLLSQKSLAQPLKELIVNLPNLFGGMEVLDAAERCTGNPRSLGAISYLRSVMRIIEESGLGKYVSVDLGMVSSLNYYTGIIFKGFTNGIGFPFISGGRYDTLSENYGVSVPATGFSLGIHLLLQAMSKQQGDSASSGEYLTVALPKGRLGDLALDLFKNAGADVSELEKGTRKLIITDESSKVRFFLVKPADVPTYVDYGAADIGVVGRDTIMEEDRNLYEVLDLGYGKCRMCVAGPKALEGKLDALPNKCVATKYPHIARSYFEHVKQESVEIIKLNGSIELAPLVGLSDVIVDIVESGRTLKENGLVVLETVFEASARMIVNRVSMKIKRERIKDIIENIKEQLKES